MKFFLDNLNDLIVVQLAPTAFAVYLNDYVLIINIKKQFNNSTLYYESYSRANNRISR